ncbi:hypothetical protein [Tumebacillus permanentifrigoris]|uniref:Uncharacterized protein n=1 Tax=Tumebacillus permanentifrigoris TaxID=378543 RepID=A0A316E0L4_9BACL|nr:hypothetical protein [Tumebacillus permanentifrigoris]PWK16350.1 hypothetical protein C7459_101214 [Tumebacillus permanentifrigoris]
MWKRVVTSLLLVVTLVSASPVQAALEPEKIQVYDVKKQEVVKKIENTEQLQAEAKKWLGSITGPSPRVNMGADKGLLVKIPMDPPTRVDNEWLAAQITEINLILRPGDKPALLLYSDQNQAQVFEFTHDVTKFLKKVHLQVP